jgi:hypothetical protein
MIGVAIVSKIHIVYESAVVGLGLDRPLTHGLYLPAELAQSWFVVAGPA